MLQASASSFKSFEVSSKFQAHQSRNWGNPTCHVTICQSAEMGRRATTWAVSLGSIRSKGLESSTPHGGHSCPRKNLIGYVLPLEIARAPFF